jgi:hypothetical protein
MQPFELCITYLSRVHHTYVKFFHYYYYYEANFVLYRIQSRIK